MQKLLKHSTYRYFIITIPLLSTLALFLVTFWYIFLPKYETSVVEKKKEMVKELTISISNTLSFYDEQVKRGNLSLESAQEMAKEHVENTRYGINNKNYFWINDYSPRMIMHPYLKELENQDLSFYQDEEGNLLFLEMARLAKNEGEGYVSYIWQWLDATTKNAPKISYVRGFDEWEWLIGTGVYLDDIKAEIASVKRQLLLISFLIFIAMALLMSFVIYRSIRREKHLDEIELKYGKLLESANDAFLLIHDYKIVDCNKKALEFFQCERKDILDHSIVKVSPELQPDGRTSKDKASDLITRCIKGESLKFDWVHKTLIGDLFFTEVSLNKVSIDNKKYLLAIVRDITERKETEAQLMKAKENAEEADKLKTAFLANMSHEIRTPMNGIMGFSQLLKDPNISEEKRSEFINVIHNRGKHLLQIINDIIDIAKIESNQLSINFTIFSLNELMEELFSIFNPDNNESKKGKLELRYTTTLLDGNDWILCDQIRLTQVLSNLISNAIKYTDEGTVHYGYILQDGSIKFYVQDTGIGVPHDKQDIIFERFRQNEENFDRKYGGTGLGLSISKGIIELLEGTIGVESDGQTGSLFYFTIPYLEAQKGKKPTGKEIVQDASANWRDKSILVVEDDEVSFNLIHEILSPTNASIIHLKDGEKVVPLLQKSHKINLVLMDIQLPGMDGNSLTRQIRKFNKKIPIIAQTANAMADDRSKSIKAGCNDYIAKPINGSKLLNVINTYL